jgi:hypothetical protein
VPLAPRIQTRIIRAERPKPQAPAEATSTAIQDQVDLSIRPVLQEALDRDEALILLGRTMGQLAGLDKDSLDSLHQLKGNRAVSLLSGA